MVTSARQWKSKSKEITSELDLPSGNTVIVRRIAPEAFLETGLIPDPLSGMINKAIQSKRGLPPTVQRDIASDPKKVAAAVEMFDRVLCYTVVEPPVEMQPVCAAEGCGQPYTNADIHLNRSSKDYHRFVEQERDPDVLYSDQVDMEDKQFIFQYCIGGAADAESFREEHTAAVGAIQQGEDLQHETE